MMVVVIISLYY